MQESTKLKRVLTIVHQMYSYLASALYHLSLSLYGTTAQTGPRPPHFEVSR